MKKNGILCTFRTPNRNEIMKIRCIVIDDEPLALQQMVNYVEKIPYLELVKACTGPTEAMEIMATEKLMPYLQISRCPISTVWSIYVP